MRYKQPVATWDCTKYSYYWLWDCTQLYTHMNKCKLTFKKMMTFDLVQLQHGVLHVKSAPAHKHAFSVDPPYIINRMKPEKNCTNSPLYKQDSVARKLLCCWGSILRKRTRNHEGFNYFFVSNFAGSTNSSRSLLELVVRNTVIGFASAVSVLLLLSQYRSIVSGSEVFNPTNKKEPIHLKCSSFKNILNHQQIKLCKHHHKLLSTTAIGTLQALNQCQKLFKDRPWNCSVFAGQPHYLGRFIENGIHLYSWYILPLM